MVGVPTFEAKSAENFLNRLFHDLNHIFIILGLSVFLPGLTGSTDCVLGDTLLSFDHNGAVWTRAKPQVGMTPNIMGTFRF